ncbi:MAG: 50S ribosomal protein L6 [Archaeoglobaceae archaeon]|nr:50S ribosomal protein L6 [Archaeoglobales archaeon]MDI9643130.1 50S ribosomal protein L6 [Archaeoglobales archaeon]
MFYLLTSTEYSTIVKIPEGVEVAIEGDPIAGYKLIAKGPLGENTLLLKFRDVFIERSGDGIRVYTPVAKAKYKAVVGTYTAHINNLIKGVKEGFEYKLKVFYAHFPVKLRVSGNEVIIENFLGETTPRKAKIVGRAKVEIKGQEITVKGVDIEECGQTAANLERATKIRDKDRRVFQDGIYIVKKP